MRSPLNIVIMPIWKGTRPLSGAKPECSVPPPLILLLNQFTPRIHSTVIHRQLEQYSVSYQLGGSAMAALHLQGARP